MRTAPSQHIHTDRCARITVLVPVECRGTSRAGDASVSSTQRRCTVSIRGAGDGVVAGAARVAVRASIDVLGTCRIRVAVARRICAGVGAVDEGDDSGGALICWISQEITTKVFGECRAKRGMEGGREGGKGILTNGKAPVLVGNAALEVVDELIMATVGVGAQDPSPSK